MPGRQLAKRLLPAPGGPIINMSLTLDPSLIKGTAMPNVPSKTKAYSYLRFSTPEQRKGDSYRRQTELAENYAARHGLELDDTFNFHDLGVSAFRGANVATGMLGYFKEAVEAGEIAQGSFLLVESLDRISRQSARRAQRVLEDIIDLGVSVVTLNDGREYSSVSLERDPFELMVSLLTFIRANEESAMKSSRLKGAWGAKRAAADRKPLTSQVPAWMRLDREAGEIKLIPERAAIVERIFRETLDGKGQHLIAADLNRESVEPWGRAKYWQRSYIAKILSNEAVIGNFVPHTLDYVDGKRTRTPQEPVQGYFPAAISEGLWADVRTMNEGKRSRQRGRNANLPVSHMLARLAVCPKCGGTMTRVMKGSRSRPALVCARAKTKAGCTYKSVRIDLVEEAIVGRLPERLRDAPAGERDATLDAGVENARAALGDVADRIERVLDAIEQGGDSRTLTSRLRELEGEYEETRDTLRALEARRAETAGQTVQARIDRLLGTLEPEEGDPLNIPAVNGAMLLVFRKVTVDYRYGVLDFEWQHGGSVELPYSLPEES